MDLQQLQARLFEQLPEGTVAALVDSKNTVLVRSHQQSERSGKPVAESVRAALELLRRDMRAATDPAPLSRQFADAGIDGVRRLFVVRSVPLTDWAVVSAVPEDQTLAGYVVARNRSLALISAAFVLAGWGAWRVGRAILVPMQGLSAAARSVARGGVVLAAPESGPTEVREVAREFNSMVRATALVAQSLRASETQYRTLLQNLPVAVVSYTPQAQVEFVNDQACALLRMTSEELRRTAATPMHWHFIDLHGNRLAPRAYPVSRVLATLQPVPPETLGIVIDGAPGEAGAAQFWVMSSGTPQWDSQGGLLRAVMTFVDVTSQRQAEQYRLAKESAEAANKAKSAFLSLLSHELRTPLNAINGFSQLMLMDPHVPPQRKLQLGYVLSAGEHLLALIDQILDIGGIESGRQKTAMRPVSLGPLLTDCIALCGPLAASAAVSIHWAPHARGLLDAQDVWVLGDGTRVRQILMNLLTNAVKYNRAGGQVAVDLNVTDEPGQAPSVAVSIADTGMGMNPVQLEGLFEPFNRVGAESSGVSGHGLGLAHARALARSMSGDITVHSVLGEGSRFTVRLRGAALA